MIYAPVITKQICTIYTIPTHELMNDLKNHPLIIIYFVHVFYNKTENI